MKTVQSIADEIVAREGGFVNDPDDPGGVTNFGITLKTLRHLGIDLDNDGDSDLRDLRMLTPKKAAEVFIHHYFKKPRIDELPEVLQPSVFDMQVNAGSNAIKILQRVLAQFGFEVRVDGVIGPATITAAEQAFATAPHHLADAYGIARRNYYYGLADARPRSRKYAKRKNGGKGGWITRAEDFLDSKYHLSADEHAKRTASWA